MLELPLMDPKLPVLAVFNDFTKFRAWPMDEVADVVATESFALKKSSSPLTSDILERQRHPHPLGHSMLEANQFVI